MKIRITLSIFLLTLSTILFGLQALSRVLTVKSFELLSSDLSARTKPVKDFNDDVCALIKISLPERECSFEPAVKQSYDITEYLVYVSPGTRKFQIKYSGTETLNLELEQLLGGQEIESGTTYRLTLTGYEELTRETPKKTDSGLNYLILNITPSTGVSVKIDGNPQSVENGQTTTLLKYGNHEYVVEADGYAPVRGTATVDKSGKTTVNVKLESILATLNVKTEDNNATIKINGQIKGTSSFSSSVMPGYYELEVTKESHKPYSTTIELSKLENKTVNVPRLTPITGMLNIEYKPTGASISIDGKVVDSTPAVINDVLIGNRKVTITKDGYEPMTLIATVSEGEISRLDGSLRKKPKGGEFFVAGEEARKAKNYAEAYNLFKEGANLGDSDCQNAIGVLYKNGYGVTKNYAEALKWYRKATDGGNASAMNNIGYLYYYGYGVTQNYAEALKWYRKAAEAGNADAMQSIAVLYYHGDGVTENHAEAMKWYRKAADAGNVDAMHKLGQMYDSGYGVSQDYTEAVKWYRKAADAGIATAMYKIGYFYENGYGVTKNYTEALKWYRKAADKGQVNAKGRLKKLGERY